jgi:16S rRNA (uracil1498-N3)-methyltransferase
VPAFFARIEGSRAVIEGEDARHLARSLRAKVGEKIEVIDPAGYMLSVRLDRVTDKSVEGTVVAERVHRPEPTWRTTIAIANLPAPALEFVLSRCTEVGAHAFIVFQADRSVARGAKLDRWARICREAAMLSGRLIVPEVSYASSVDAVLTAEDFPILLNRDAARRLDPPAEDITLLVGPEGGWTERELALAADVTASLGPRNLRAETAAVVGLAIALSVRGG